MFYPIFPGYITPCSQPTTIHIAGGFLTFKQLFEASIFMEQNHRQKIWWKKSSTIFGTLRTLKSANKKTHDRWRFYDVFDTWPFIMCFRMCTASWTIWRCPPGRWGYSSWTWRDMESQIVLQGKFQYRNHLNFRLVNKELKHSTTWGFLRGRWVVQLWIDPKMIKFCRDRKSVV